VREVAAGVIARPISTSGFSPTSTRRNSFTIEPSLYTIDVLLCSRRPRAP
jgi:hypothetical protein